VLQSGSLKLGSCKFNVIINIINITFKSGIAAKPKTPKYNFIEKFNTFTSVFFLYFSMLEKKTSPHCTGDVTSVTSNRRIIQSR
jgi:ATP/ADP translocase